MRNLISISLALAVSLTPAFATTLPQTPPELKGIGTPVTLPSGGVAVQGTIPNLWPENKASAVIFFSTITSGTTIDPAFLNELSSSNPEVQIFAVSSEAPDVLRTRLTFSEESPSARTPIILSDPTDRWKKTLLDPTERTQLPLAVAIDRSGKISWHGPGTLKQLGPTLAMHSSNTWNRDSYQKSIERSYLRANNRNRITTIRNQARADGNVENALAQFDAVIASDPTNPDLMVDRFKCLLIDLKRPDLAYAYGRTLAQNRPNDYITLNAMSWSMVSNPEVINPDLNFAQEMSERANGIQRYTNYTLIDTLARIYWMRGDGARAIDWQRKAVAIAPDSWHGDACRENLSTYVSGKVTPGTLPAPFRSARQP